MRVVATVTANGFVGGRRNCNKSIGSCSPSPAQVVVDLILDMKSLGHPSFIDLDSEKVKENAAGLPEDGVPPEVVQILQEEMGADDGPMESKLQPQKAATPSEAPVENVSEAGVSFAAQRPHAVVAEGRSTHSAQDVEMSALQDMVAELSAPAELQTFEIRAGNQLLDMFRPCYWSLAFCFLFKHAAAEPDVTNTVAKPEEVQMSRRRRGNKKAPEVGIHSWAAAMQRQVACQFRRDWNFSPALWNYIFRTMINLQPNSSKFTVQDSDGSGRRNLTHDELRKAAEEICRTVKDGLYVDINGEHKAVNGDLTKLRHVPTLSAAAHKMLTNVEAPRPQRGRNPRGAKHHAASDARLPRQIRVGHLHHLFAIRARFHPHGPNGPGQAIRSSHCAGQQQALLWPSEAPTGCGILPLVAGAACRGKASTERGAECKT